MTALVVNLGALMLLFVFALIITVAALVILLMRRPTMPMTWDPRHRPFDEPTQAAHHRRTRP